MTRIEALRQIVATKKAAKLDGHVVDTFTASRLLESYKTLDGAGRRRFASMSVDKMVTAGPINDNQHKNEWINAIELRLNDVEETLTSIVNEVVSTTIGSGPTARKQINNLAQSIKTAISFVRESGADVHAIKTLKMVTAGDNGDDVNRMLKADRDEALKYVDKAIEHAISAILQADKDFLGSGLKSDDVQAKFSKPLRMLFKAAILKKWPRPDID